MHDAVIRYGGRSVPVKVLGSGPRGATGPSNNTRETLEELKAAPVSDVSSIYDGHVWTWRDGDYTGQADDETIVASDDFPLSVGAWVRTSEGGGDGSAALIRLKTFNVEDFGAVANSDGTGTSGVDNSAAFNAALAAMKDAGGGTLVIPAGETAYRVHQPETLIDFDRCEIICNGQVYFSNADVGFWGRLRIDGRDTIAGRIERFHMEGTGKMFGRPGLHSTGMFVPDGAGETYQIGGFAPGLGPGYGGEDCLIQMRNIDGFAVHGLRLLDSPNYVISGLNIAEGVFRELRISHGTAAIQCQDGTRAVAYDGVYAFDTSDDLLAYGYHGARNKDCAIRNCNAQRSGARGLVMFSMGEAVISGNRVGDTFLAAVLAEMSNYAGDRITDDLQIINNIIKNGGMYDGAPYVRGVDVAAGIRISSAYAGARIKRATITGNQVRNSCNSHMTSDGLGVVDKLILAQNIFDGIGRIVVPDEPIIGNGGAGGRSIAPPDGYYPGVKLNNVVLPIVESNAIIGAHEDGTYVSPAASLAQLHHNVIEQINNKIDGGPGFSDATGIVSDAQNTFASNNSLSDSPATSVLYEVANQTLPATGAMYPRSAVTVSDNFNRANIAPTSGGLGNTAIGGKAWTGSPAGITGNKAYFGAVADQAVVFNSGSLDQDISVTIDVTSEGQRLIARADSSAPTTGPAIIFDTSGNLFHWNGAAIAKLTPFGAIASGTHTLRLMVKGNTAVAYVDGGIIAILRGTFPASNYVGFSDHSAGLGRFDNFTSSPVPAPLVAGRVQAGALQEQTITLPNAQFAMWRASQDMTVEIYFQNLAATNSLEWNISNGDGLGSSAQAQIADGATVTRAVTAGQLLQFYGPSVSSYVRVKRQS